MSATLATFVRLRKLHSLEAGYSGIEFMPKQADVTQTLSILMSLAMASQLKYLVFFKND